MATYIHILIAIVALIAINVEAREAEVIDLTTNLSHYLTIDGNCQVYKLLVNYRRMKLNILCRSGMGRASWSSKLTGDCDDIREICDEETSAICIPFKRSICKRKGLVYSNCRVYPR
jgi:hypothetical protein